LVRAPCCSHADLVFIVRLCLDVQTRLACSGSW
jgi:hypothetical protein